MMYDAGYIKYPTLHNINHKSKNHKSQINYGSYCRYRFTKKIKEEKLALLTFMELAVLLLSTFYQKQVSTLIKKLTSGMMMSKLLFVM